MTRTRARLYAALAAASLLAFCTRSEADTLGIDTLSVHLPQQGQDDFNPGAYYRFDNGAGFGAYHNSMRRVSVWVGWSWASGPFAMTLGGITGYQRKNVEVACGPGFTYCYRAEGASPGAIAPLIAPSVSLPAVLGITPRIVFMPGIRGASNVFHLTLEKSL